MLTPISWFKHDPELLEALNENRVVMFLPSRNGFVRDSAHKIHRISEYRGWLSSTDFDEREFTFHNLRVILFENDFQAKLFMINFGITFNPVLDPDS